MGTPRNAETERSSREIRAISETGALWRCLECLAGGVTAVVVILISLPVLLDLMRPLEPLSTTILASLFLLAWLVLWAAFGTSREHLTANE